MGCVSGKDSKAKLKAKNQMSIKEQAAANKYRANGKPFQSQEDPHVICSLSHLSNEDRKNSQFAPRKFNSHKHLGMDSAYSASGALTQPTTTKTGNQFSRSAYLSSHDLALKNSQHPVTLEYVLARKTFVENQHIPIGQRLNMFPAPKLKSVDSSSLLYRRKLEHQEEEQAEKMDQQ